MKSTYTYLYYWNIIIVIVFIGNVACVIRVEAYTWGECMNNFRTDSPFIK